MITEGNATDLPQFASTHNAPHGSLPDDRWTGTKLGKYHVTRRLGFGGMGVVYEAKDPVLDRSVAIKVLRDSLASDPHAVRKFLREARTAAKLNSPHIVAVYEADEESGRCYLVMELMDGGSAHDRVRKWGPFGWIEATQVLADACRGLTAVHAAGLIHRDIKPSNIMRVRDGMVKLADFGLALTVAGSPSDSSGQRGQIVGTPLFMSPEQCRGEKIDPRSDIYALGATYFSLLTGRPPFDGPSATDIMIGHCTHPIPDARAVDGNIPTACADLIRRAMAKTPDDRPQSAASLLGELELILMHASSPELPQLDWVPDLDHRAETLTQLVTEEAIKSRKTRIWFVTLCLMLTACAYAAGRYFSRTHAGGSIQENISIRQSPDVAAQPPLSMTEIDAGDCVNSLAFDPLDNDSLSWGTQSGGIKVMRRQFHSDRFPHGGNRTSTIVPVLQVAFAPAGNLWVNLREGELDFRETKGFGRILEDRDYCAIPNAKIKLFAFHPTRKILALAFAEESTKKGGIRIRRFDRKIADAPEVMEDKQTPTCAAFSTDGSLLVCGRLNGTLQILNVSYPDNYGSDESKPLATKSGGVLSVGAGEVTALAAMDERNFAVAIGSKVVICDCKQGKKGEVVHEGKIGVTCLAISPAAKKLALAFGNTVRMYNWESTTPTTDQHEHSAPVTALAFDKEGKILASGDSLGKIRVWPVNE